MTRLKTFLVEDCHTTRDHLADTLEEQAHARVIGWASTEANAIQWLAKNKTAWDLAVLDLFLAEGSGLNVLKSLEKRPGQRVVVLSNYLTASVRQRCLAMGADGVFDKSTQLDELVCFAAEMRQTAEA
ncbi:MAG: response regulator [Polaromonas sp.]|nr:response regulator [Polaromonas sp.]